jgi:hypothetical protein
VRPEPIVLSAVDQHLLLDGRACGTHVHHTKHLHHHQPPSTSITTTTININYHHQPPPSPSTSTTTINHLHHHHPPTTPLIINLSLNLKIVLPVLILCAETFLIILICL